MRAIRWKRARWIGRAGIGSSPAFASRALRHICASPRDQIAESMGGGAGHGEGAVYWKSFPSTAVEAYTRAFNEDGFVVVDGVLDESERQASIGEVWEYLASESHGKVDRRDASTWNNENWPAAICRNGGFAGRFPYMRRLYRLDKTMPVNKQPQAWRNRENVKVYDVFKNILGTHKLWASIDRYGVMRPTLSEKSEDAGVIERIEWQTKKDWLHWDLNPFHYATSAAGFARAENFSEEQLASAYGSLRVQGLITLTDCPEESGGFHCVPRFHGAPFEKWREEHMHSYGKQDGVHNRNFVEVPDDDPMRSRVMRVPMRAGSLLVWNSQLPHGNFPNSGHQWRMVFYIKMIPVDDPREFQPILSVQDPRLHNQDWFGDRYTPSCLGRRLLGLTEWSDPIATEEGSVIKKQTG
ncbi:hypothetical protein FVE85_8250 [Porphyridium purpureum]|uniref:Phytanoyl-CoA dioxygenase n=1 Tax=Porphyridium purpureum TaxID=35688 RepID=A0A5J4YKG7_PORPP|nr:hypothetical protein FVE85_8250 [Porphyridium purpureum]|eukprot:POR2857..scf244_11